MLYKDLFLNEIISLILNHFVKTMWVFFHTVFIYIDFFGDGKLIGCVWLKYLTQIFFDDVTLCFKESFCHCKKLQYDFCT